MASYGDMTGDADGIMYMGKYRGSDNKDLNGFSLYKFSLKAAPKAGVNLAHSWAQEKKLDDSQAVSTKSSSKVDMKHGDAKVTVTAGHDKVALQVEGPVVDGDWSVDGSFLFDDKIGKERKVEAGFEVASPDMGGTKAKMNFGLEHVMKQGDTAAEAETTLKFDACLDAKDADVLVGMEAEYDLKTVSALAFGAAKKDDGNKYWVGYDHSNKFAKTGCLIDYKDKGFKHSYEARYSLEPEGKGFLGQSVPLSIGAGGKYGLSKASSMAYMVELSSQVHAQAKFTHKIDSNWTVAATQSFNKADCGSKRTPYNLGFDVSYAL